MFNILLMTYIHYIYYLEVFHNQANMLLDLQFSSCEFNPQLVNLNSLINHFLKGEESFVFSLIIKTETELTTYFL